MLRLSLVIAIIAALAVAVINFVMVREKITTLVTERNDWHGKYDKSQTELAKTKNDLEKTTADLNTTKETLATTTSERDKAQAEVASLAKQKAELSDKYTKTTQERDEARQNLFAFTQTGLTPAQILGFKDQIKQLQDTVEVAKEENKVLTQKYVSTKTKLDLILGVIDHVPLPDGLKGKVIASDPKWDFVVLDVGADQGVLENGELLVNRNGHLVARVRVRTVEKNRCIANVLPAWKLGDVLEGDQVLSAL